MRELGTRLLEAAAKASSLVAESLRRHGDAPLRELVRSLQTTPVEPVQPRDDLWAAMHQQAAWLYGPQVADEAVAELRANPIMPTSNHFGIDTFADSVQGTLLFSMLPGADGARRRTVVTLGTGTVSLDNLTYPMGLRLYDPDSDGRGRLVRRLAVFPGRCRHRMVAAAEPFDEGMVARARDRLRKARRAGEVTTFCERAAGEVLEAVFGAQATLRLPTYSQQSTAVNSGLWRRMLRGDPAPRLVQLQVEPVCAALLAKDLHDRGSLLHHLLFTPRVREALLARLDGARACWRLGRLRGHLDRSAPVAGPGSGTVFFWALGGTGRRVPLLLERDGASLRLAGIDQGRRRHWEFTADGIEAGLREGQLLPSSFVCLASLAFARGVVGVGGYYQVEYLPVMQRGVVGALRAEPGLRTMAELVARVPTTRWLAGLQGVVRALEGGAVIPAGPVEIGGAGGLTGADLARLGSVPVREAHLAAFPELFTDLAPDAEVPEDWMWRLARENGARCANLVCLTTEETACSAAGGETGGKRR